MFECVKKVSFDVPNYICSYLILAVVPGTSVAQDFCYDLTYVTLNTLCLCVVRQAMFFFSLECVRESLIGFI